MREVCLIFLAERSFDSLNVFAGAFARAGFQVEKIEIPYVWQFGRDYLARIKRLLRQKEREKEVLFNPQSAEIFLDHQGRTFLYSAYQSWFDPIKLRVIPHLWGPVKPPASFEPLKWKDKPPLRVGFMGRAFEDSRLANAALKLCHSAREWLVKGQYVRYPGALAILNDAGMPIKSLGAFPRIELLEVIKNQHANHTHVNVDLVHKNHFGGSMEELAEYASHLEENTYVLCPRGTENYSYRMYETLSRGRVPVILDTDMVLPSEVNWKDVSISIPYSSIDKTYEIILRDYESNSAADFRLRQEKAFATMRDLYSLRWVDQIANEF